MSSIDADDPIQLPANPGLTIFGVALTLGLLLAAVIALYLAPQLALEQLRRAVAANDFDAQRTLVDPGLDGSTLGPYLDATMPGSGRRIEKRYAGLSRFLVISRGPRSRPGPGSDGVVTLEFERRGFSWRLANISGRPPWTASRAGGEGRSNPAAPMAGEPDASPPPAGSGSPPPPGAHVRMDVLPKVLERAAPLYPEAARLAGVEGTVLVQARVGEDGRVVDARVLKSVPMLDDAALAAVRQWRFRPAMGEGRPVAVWVAVPVRFSLR